MIWVLVYFTGFLIALRVFYVADSNEAYDKQRAAEKAGKTTKYVIDWFGVWGFSLIWPLFLAGTLLYYAFNLTVFRPTRSERKRLEEKKYQEALAILEDRK